MLSFTTDAAMAFGHPRFGEATLAQGRYAESRGVYRIGITAYGPPHKAHITIRVSLHTDIDLPD